MRESATAGTNTQVFTGADSFGAGAAGCVSTFHSGATPSETTVCAVGSELTDGVRITQGTKPTITGCGTITSQVGGALAGTFVTSVTGSCTPVLTGLPNPTGSYITGYFCTLIDRTTGTGVAIINTSSTASTATFPSLTTVASDVLAFSCPVAY